MAQTCVTIRERRDLEIDDFRTGAGKALKAAIPDVKIVLAEPEAAGLLASGVATERNPDGSPKASHPAFAAHPIQGWTPDFIPKVLEDAPMAELQDELFPIPGDAAVNTAKALAAKEGLLTGISGGGTMYAALETAKKARVRRLRKRHAFAQLRAAPPTDDAIDATRGRARSTR